MVLLPTISSSQAWSILVRHARETHDLRLDSLCADVDRVAALVEAYTASNDGSIILDLSRQRMTEATVNHLLGLARSRHLYEFIQQLAWGQNDPKAPIHKQPTPAISSNNNRDDIEESIASILHPQLAQFKESKLATAALANANSVLPSKLDTSAVTMDSEILGQISQPPSSSIRPQHMHMAMRVPSGNNHVLFDHNAHNVLTDIHNEWHRIERFSEAVRLGTLVSADNQLFRDVLVVGKGTAVTALEFVHHALQCDERALLSSKLGLGSNATEFMTLPRIRSHLTGTPLQSTPAVTPRQLHFLKAVDPVTIAKVTSSLDPGRTLVISIALQGNEDTGVVTKLLKQWMLDYHHYQQKKSSSSPDHVLSKHMILVTANQRIASVINKPESVYVIPSHSRCEPLINFSAATLLPLAVVYGWPIVQEFLEGAHDMDRHFVEKPPRHNIPILLALTDVWNDVLKESSSPVARIVTPFAKALTHFPKFVGALESQMCSKSSPSSVQNGRPMGRTSARPVGHKSGLASMYNGCSSIVVDGGTEGMYDRSLLQSENTLINSELIMIMDSQVQFHVARSTMASSGIVAEAQDAQMCAFFAHADELAFGGTKTERNNPHNAPWTSTTAASVTSKTTFSHFQHVGDSDWSEGNRPSTLLMCGRLDAFSCGQLISLSEHRATVKAHIWGIDPFVREVGSELCRERTEELQAELAKMFTETSSVPDGEEKAEEDDLQLCLSTKTILRHYSKLYEGREKL